MPANEIQYPATYACVSNNSYTRTACPPIRQDCIPMDLTCIWVDCDTCGYNCNLCNGVAYCIPYLQDDKIMLQTQLPDQQNVDETAPLFGWQGDTATYAYRAELCDKDGAVLTNDITQFASRYMVAYTNSGGGVSYQTIEVDTALIAANFPNESCFSVTVHSITDILAVPTVQKTVYSEPFCIDNTCRPEDLVQVMGIWTGFDCCGNYYGDPRRTGPATIASVGNAVFQFDNTYRMYARIFDTGNTIEKESFNNNVTNITVISLFELKLQRPIPPYMKNIFVNQHYGAKNVFVNGVEYFAGTNIQDKIGTQNNMFLFDAELTQECERNENCDN